jgi:hypothetical protein
LPQGLGSQKRRILGLYVPAVSETGLNLVAIAGTADMIVDVMKGQDLTTMTWLVSQLYEPTHDTDHFSFVRAFELNILRIWDIFGFWTR